MIYVIGDIHGEIGKLEALTGILGQRGYDRLIFIGDYIDKGAGSGEVIDFLIELGGKGTCIFLQGNHEYMLLRALKGDMKAVGFLENYGGLATVKAYLKDCFTGDMKKDILALKEAIPGKHLRFMENTVPCHFEPGYLMVHAGVDPDKICMDKACKDLYFIRYKFIEYQGKIMDRRVVFGHTAFKTPYFDPFKVGIDTGAAYDGYGHLTAYNIRQGFCINHLGQVFYDPYFVSTIENSKIEL